VVTHSKKREWLVLASVKAFTATPTPRHHKTARPYISTGRSSSKFLDLLRIIPGIAHIGDGPSIFHEPDIDVFTCDSALGNDAAVAIDIALYASDCAARNMILKNQ
jgi:hypothetical protein